MGQEHDNSTTESRFAKLISTTVSTALVGLFLAGVGSGLIAWRSISVHDTRLSILEAWKSEGGRYTADHGTADRLASLAGDEREAQTRENADIRILEDISELKAAVESCKKYRADHRVESQKGFGLIDQCMSELRRLRAKIEDQ